MTPDDIVNLAARRVAQRGIRSDHPEYADHLAAEAVLIAVERSQALAREQRCGFRRTMRQGSAAPKPQPDTSATFTRGEAEREQPQP